MKRCIVKGFVAVWLLTILAMPFTVRVVHFCHVQRSSSQHTCSHHCHSHNQDQNQEHDQEQEQAPAGRHNCKSCVICQFTLPAFEEAEAPARWPVPVARPFRPAVSFPEKILTPSFITCHLRGPPMTAA
jgi:hypothetical protein